MADNNLNTILSYKEVKIDDLSPMMRQYVKMKNQNPDCLLMFRLGDFYELFFEDAMLVSKELDLVLTGRACGKKNKAPMCGVPFHAADSYISKLISKGYKVGICEQLKLNSNDIAERDIVRIITPGTVMDGNVLETDQNNYLLSLCKEGETVGICWADISTGEFNRVYFDAQIALRLNDLLVKINPAEILCNAEMKEASNNLSVVKYGSICQMEQLGDDEFDLVNAEQVIKEMCKDSKNILLENATCIKACGALLRYVKKTQKRNITHLHSEDIEAATMALDTNVIKTLELLRTTDGKKRGSLWNTINKTSTGMGARLLGKWVVAPVIDEKIINNRLDAVEELTKNGVVREELRNCLSKINDIERGASRLSYGNIQPNGLLSLANSFKSLPQIKKQLSSCKSSLLRELTEAIDTMSDIEDWITTAINDETSASEDKGIFKKGYNAELDEYKSISKNVKGILIDLAASEKQKTGIKNLKVAYNGVFGYYIEVPKSQIDLVPYNYVRKQTTANTERYITDELKVIEDKVLHAEERKNALEDELYKAFVMKVSAESERIFRTAKVIAEIDVLVSAAIVAVENKYTRPIIGKDIKAIKILEGRHPVVESQLYGNFVPNDAFMNDSDHRILIITGPNMAGKSIYMKQVAQITILAHMGFFVPAEHAEITLTDRVFTRVGASDDLHTGRSTFMVEMSEVSYILNNVTDKSLVLLDEVGRGTATYDGLSIAWAIIQYLSRHSKAKVMFSTHYHELTDLEGVLEGVKNYKITVRETNGTIAFLHKVLRGSANKSFGIEVASLSGLPDEVISEAKEILNKLEDLNIARKDTVPRADQISLFVPGRGDEIIQILKELDLDDVTPRTAYTILCDLKEKAEVK